MGAPALVIVAVAVLVIVLLVWLGGLSGGVVLFLGLGANGPVATADGVLLQRDVPTAIVHSAAGGTPRPETPASREDVLAEALREIAQSNRVQAEAADRQAQAFNRQAQAFDRLSSQLSSRPKPQEHRHFAECSHGDDGWSQPVRPY